MAPTPATTYVLATIPNPTLGIPIRWWLTRSEWDCINTIMALGTHPAPTLMLFPTTITGAEALAWADAVLHFTGKYCDHRHDATLAHVWRSYKFNHVDRWAPLAQEIVSNRPKTLDFATSERIPR